MEILWEIAKFWIAWFVGNFAAIPVTQIGCCVFCSMNLLRRMEHRADCINISGAKRFYKRAIFVNAAIFALESGAVVLLAPRIMECGFFCSIAFSIVMGCGKWGCNETNVDEFVNILQRFVIDGKEDEALMVLTDALRDTNVG